MTIDTENIYDHVTADTLEVGDQTIIDGDLIRIINVVDTDDIDEIRVRVENLSDPTGDEWLSLFADDTYPLWSM